MVIIRLNYVIVTFVDGVVPLRIVKPMTEETVLATCRYVERRAGSDAALELLETLLPKLAIAA